MNYNNTAVPFIFHGLAHRNAIHSHDARHLSFEHITTEVHILSTYSRMYDNTHQLINSLISLRLRDAAVQCNCDATLSAARSDVAVTRAEATGCRQVCRATARLHGPMAGVLSALSVPCQVLVGKLTVAQLATTRRFITCSQESATEPHPERDDIAHRHIMSSLHFNIILTFTTSSFRCPFHKKFRTCSRPPTRAT
jgi:hypothetical protein